MSLNYCFLSAELLRFSDYIPPFNGASPEQAHIGINYASGGGGLLEETSQNLVRTGQTFIGIAI